jgi:hypothetical protein
MAWRPLSRDNKEEEEEENKPASAASQRPLFAS